MISIASDRQYSYSELFSLSSDFFKKNFASIAVVVAFFYALISITYAIYPRSNGVVSLLVSAFIQFVIFQIFVLNKADSIPSASYFFTSKGNTSFNKDLFSTIFAYYWRTALWSLLFLIPGLIFGTYWEFAFFITIDKKLVGKPALDYSRQLVKGHWWKVFSLLCLQILSYAFISILFGVFMSGFIPTLISDICGGLAQTFFSIALMYFYLNLDASSQVRPEAPISAPITSPQTAL